MVKQEIILYLLNNFILQNKNNKVNKKLNSKNYPKKPLITFVNRTVQELIIFFKGYRHLYMFFVQ